MGDNVTRKLMLLILRVCTF